MLESFFWVSGHTMHSLMLAGLWQVHDPPNAAAPRRQMCLQTAVHHTTATTVKCTEVTRHPQTVQD
jgi:hypothetical protein